MGAVTPAIKFRQPNNAEFFRVGKKKETKSAGGKTGGGSGENPLS